MCWTDDPVRDAENYYRKQEKDIWENCPICVICGEPIQDDYAWCVNEDWMHEDCAESEFRRRLW